MFRRIVALVSALTMAAVGLVALPVAVAPANAAPPGDAFDPGLIISDSVFFDFGSMDVAGIQQFLDSRVSTCRAEDPAIDCLKSIKVEIPETPATTPQEIGPCSAIPANPQASAAEVIYSVAVACGISPKVLITTLQKEQGLVTSTKPTSYMYRAAMGFGCPDSDPGICGKVYVGLFNQVYRAAKQLRWYGNPEGSFTYWKPGRTVSMRYNPKSSCGTKSFELKNQATANLYYYTPYTPNQAALSNLYGSGDSCSAYGNRNFWRFYHDWFGSPIGGGYLLSGTGPETYLIVDDKKYLVSDSRLLAALRPMGPIGEISQAYLDSFGTSGEMTQLVSDSATGMKYLLVDGVKYQANDCSVAAAFGVDCNITTALTSLQLNAFVDGGVLTRLVTTQDGNRYWIENASSRVVVDDLALQAVGAQSITPTPMTIEQVASVQQGAALASESLMFKVAGLKEAAIASEGKTYLFNSSLVSSTSLAKWFDQAAKTVDYQAIEANLHPEVVRGFVKSTTGNAFVLTPAGKLPVSDIDNWTDLTVTLPEALLAKIPTVSATLSSPAVVTAKGSKYTWFIQASERYQTSDSSMAKSFLNLIDQPSAVELPLAAIYSVTKVASAIAPGSIIKSSSSSTRYLVDDLNSKIKLASSAQASAVSKSKTYTVAKAELDALSTRTGFTSSKVQCNGENYLLDGGVLYPTSVAVAAEFPGEPFVLAASTCASMQLSPTSVGQFIRNSSGTIYFIEDGTKQRITSSKQYETLRADGPGYIQASAYLDASIPSAGKAPQEVELASYVPAANGDFGELTFKGTLPAPVQADPTSEPVQPPTPAPVVVNPEDSAAGEQQEYRVRPGDTLSKIASKFGVSTSLLQAFNKISNPNFIRVGQLILIPGSTNSNQVAEPTPEPSPTQEPEPEPAPEADATTGDVEYRVQSGDTLLRIAYKFGISTSALQSYNSITNPNRISIGQVLRIPTATSNTNVAQAQPEPEPVAMETYRVVTGDTLWGISRKLGVKSSALAALNGINNVNFIRVGQVLKVPN